MTSVRDADVRRPAASPALLLAVPAVAVGLVVLLALVLLVPVWLAVLVALAAGAGLAAWLWSRATAVVRARSAGAPAEPERHAQLINVVDGLCLAAGVQRPAIDVVDDPGANALIAGRNERDAVLVVTTGLLAATDRIQLEGVVAHQLVQLRDPGLAAATLTATTGVVPALRRLGEGDDRQTWADLDAVALTRYPPGLLGALEACERVGTTVRSGHASTTHLWMAPPVAGAQVPRSVDERIAILREL